MRRTAWMGRPPLLHWLASCGCSRILSSNKFQAVGSMTCVSRLNLLFPIHFIMSCESALYKNWNSAGNGRIAPSSCWMFADGGWRWASNWCIKYAEIIPMKAMAICFTIWKRILHWDKYGMNRKEKEMSKNVPNHQEMIQFKREGLDARRPSKQSSRTFRSGHNLANNHCSACCVMDAVF